MDDVVAELPKDKEIHVILDNYCIHKRCDLWLADHLNVSFHFTPTYASWLNQVEIWFGIFTRKALRGASFDSTGDLIRAIEAFVAAYGEAAKPFVWRKREVKEMKKALEPTVFNLPTPARLCQEKKRQPLLQKRLRQYHISSIVKLRRISRRLRGELCVSGLFLFA